MPRAIRISASRALRALNTPTSVESLVAFRVLFGGLICVSSIRFLESKWVERCFVHPTFFFKYYGFEWVDVLPASWMHAVFVSLAVLALCLAVGFYYKAATFLFLALFTYVELIDLTNYLNHYYLVSLLALVLLVLPLHRAGSIDSLRRPSLRITHVPAWMLWLLRFQVGVVYVFAALAKFQADWLVYGQPIHIWMSARTDIPLIGAWISHPDISLLLSWAGFFNDLFAVPFLLWRRTRAWAYATVVVFHFLTHVFFTIGVFPFLMMISATLFFSPDWPSRFVRRFSRRCSSVASQMRLYALPEGKWFAIFRRVGPGIVVAYCVAQLALPLRAHLYPGSVLWHEQGMRFSWRVMVREKNGSVTYRVVSDRGEYIVMPRRYLTLNQEQEMSAQPDMILQLAHRIASDYEAKGFRDVKVYADALVSLNGRRMRRLIDPNVDLVKVRDGLGVARWIAPSPEEPPLGGDVGLACLSDAISFSNAR